jgi:multidrug resistance efflux pump
MSNEQIYLYRRKGMSDYATCDMARYVELSQHKLFETMVCYASADTDEVERLRAELETLRHQHAEQSCVFCNDSGELLTEVKTLRAQLADAAQSLETISLQAGRDEFMKDMTQIRGYANSRARVAKGSLSANAEASSHD